MKVMAAAALCGLAVSVASATVSFTDRLEFIDSATNAGIMLGLESFEEFTATNSIDQTTLVADDFTITTDSPPDLGVYDAPASWGAFATDGIKFVGYQSAVDEAVHFSYNSPIHAWGLDITDIGDFGTGELTFSNDVGDFFTVFVTPGSNGNQIFFGVINPDFAFTHVMLTNTVAGEAFGFDAVAYGAIPAPASIALLALGLVRRRR
jgi:hypothetical protein